MFHDQGCFANAFTCFYYIHLSPLSKHSPFDVPLQWSQLFPKKNNCSSLSDELTGLWFFHCLRFSGDFFLPYYLRPFGDFLCVALLKGHFLSRLFKANPSFLMFFAGLWLVASQPSHFFEKTRR